MRRVLIAVLTVALFAAPPATFVAEAGNGVQQLRVMTRNIYVGASIFRILDAEPEEIPFVVTAMMQTVFDTNFPERAEALADEIKKARPHLIGLQEVSLLRVQSPGDFLFGNQLPAEDVLFDYLAILQAALAARGLDYVVAGVVENADVELPMFAGIHPDGYPLFDDIRLTDRDVVLARADVATSNVTARNFADNISFPIGPLTVPFLRGFVALDAEVKGRSYRFVNTHLEVQTFTPYYQSVQAAELIAELAGAADPVIVVGDLNSEPDDPVASPYAQFAAAGYVDAWLVKNGKPKPGYTCCQAEALDNPKSLLDERIDYVLVRNSTDFPAFPDLGPVRAKVVGANAKKDKTDSGLWPSDHAGLAVKMIVPPAP